MMKSADLDLDDLQDRYIRKLQHSLLRSFLLVLIIYGISYFVVLLILNKDVSKPPRLIRLDTDHWSS